MSFRHVRFYHKDTGVLHPSIVMASSEEAVDLNTPPDHEVIDIPPDIAGYDHMSQRVDLETKTVVDWQPPQPSPEHEWDATCRRWQLNAQARDREMKRRVADSRIASLWGEERHLIRRLVLNPFDTEAKERLTAIDTEITELRLTAS